MDGIKHSAEGLGHTLFTKPSEFGSQFLNTIREAMLKPFPEGLGNMTAQMLHPAVYGRDGQGRIAGMSHGIFGGGGGFSLPAISAPASMSLPSTFSAQPQLRHYQLSRHASVPSGRVWR